MKKFSKLNLRSFLESGVISLITAIGWLPLRLRINLGSALGELFSLLPLRDRHICELQIKRFLNSSNASLITRKVYAGLGRTAAECLNLQPILRDLDRYVDCPNWALVQDVTTRKRPILALSAHTSNWEILAAYMSARGIKLATVGREARSGLLQSVLNNIRKDYGVKMLWLSGKKFLEGVIKEFRDKQAVAVLIDQDLRSDGVFIPFFGRPAKTTNTLVKLAKRFDATIVCAFIFRTTPERYTIFLKELDTKESDEEILIQYSNWLEELIREFPDQWVWIHKRWRSITSDERLSSNQYIEYLQKGFT